MVKVQPEAYRNTGTPTTNHTSRAPNSTTRAAASRLMARFLANSSFADFEALAFPINGGTKRTTPASTSANSPAMAHKETWKPSWSSKRPPRKKPTPFMAFLLPVNQATHLKSWPEPDSAVPAVSLMADLLAVLVRSLATPHTPCASTTQATDIAAVQSGDSCESSRKPVICVHRPTVSMRWMP